MNYISIYDHNTRKRLCFLENAYRVGYKKNLNTLWTAQFTLPRNDRKNVYCQHFNYVEIYDQDDYIGLFRIIPSQLKKDRNTMEITYQCEHVLATLLDDVMVGWHEIGNLGVYTNQVLQYILDQQITRNWVLADCDFRHQYLYGWEHENLLTALLSVPNPFQEQYRWEYNTQKWPWTLSLKRVDTARLEAVEKEIPGIGKLRASRTRVGAKGEIRYAKNMLGIEKTSDATNICTRLYAFGYGEGVNQLNLSKVNPTGKLYLDADTQNVYGIISKVWIDKRYQLEDSLLAAAQAMLEKLKRPSVSYTVDTAHINALRGCDVGDVIRIIDDEDDISVYLPIQSIEKSDVTGAPSEAKITLGGQDDDVATCVADMNDRQRVQEAYSQGAVTLYSQSFRDNASADAPAELRFYIPQNAVHINQILLSGKITAFRGYTKATKGGGATEETTEDGGSTTQTSASGGGGSVTSGSGGGGTTSVSTSQTSATSSTNPSSTQTSTTYSGKQEYTGYSSPGSTTYATTSSGNTSGSPSANRFFSHSHNYVGMPYNATGGSYNYGWHRHLHLAVYSHNHKITIPGHSHSVTIPGHSHSVNISSHTHSVSIGSHTHSVSIPSHKHRFKLPDHTHAIEYGIYKGSTAKQVTISVDGTNIAGAFTSINDLNLIPYLTTDDEGNIARGWHTLQVTPDTLTRIEMDLVIQLFANSRGGGQY